MSPYLNIPKHAPSRDFRMAAKQKLGPNQRKWLKALESGKFKQGKEVLRSIDNKFCCLGVACELFKSSEPELVGGSYDYSGEGITAPAFVVEALRLRGNVGDHRDQDQKCEHLAALNDGGKRFKTIAKIIRADPAAYFAAVA